MALSPLRSKALHLGRSLSLPTDSHPAIFQFEENLTVISLTKQDVGELLSAARRNEAYDIQAYLTSRRKSFRSKGNAISLEKDWRSMLKDAESVTFFPVGVSVFLLSHQVEDTRLNEFKKVDFSFLLIQEDDTQVEELVNHFKEMDSSIQILEEDLEFLFRQLIKTREDIPLGSRFLMG
ncbi:hypothetical protein CDL12_01528 [Handroanthus impetiginosus]|uniref:Uncharacterized protein n=1 Tax=Handroanthus impetiginosus TaxID=429701 RepID=A0A2G9I7K9_9LAMI|nr:hypothetical protein CDL12_01528 [Handroanthus impetiginosus]